MVQAALQYFGWKTDLFHFIITSHGHLDRVSDTEKSICIYILVFFTNIEQLVARFWCTFP